MKPKEQQRALVLAGVLEGRYTGSEAARVLELSPRQIRRLKQALVRDGPGALVHGNRGRSPAHALDPVLRARVAALSAGAYAGCNDQHFTELFVEHEGIVLSRSTVRRIRRVAGVRSPQRRRAPKHRARRERMPQAGMLLQVDGSRHQWLGPDGPWLTLIGGIDDATGDVPWAVFREQEDAQGYLLLLQQVARRRGIPLALYSDRHTIFQHRADAPLSVEERLAGGRQRTQVGRVLHELEITWIGARSPQAKGRVERLWRTLQDRWGQELRLRGGTTSAQANAVLPELLAQHNTRFRQRAEVPGSAYRRPPEGVAARDLFCFKYWRTVTNDNVVTLGDRTIAIPPGPLRRSYAKARVEIREHLDGSASVHYQGRCIARQNAIAGPLRTHERGRIGEKAPPSPPREAPVRTRAAAWTPGDAHPWRRDSYTTENGRQRFAAARLPSYNLDSTTEASSKRTKSRNN